MGNMAQWIQFKGLPKSNIGLINICAPNDALERCQLWEQMLLDLLENYDLG
jgi:hypothetical protein